MFQNLDEAMSAAKKQAEEERDTLKRAADHFIKQAQEEE
jgi:hypothetical protein